MIVFSTQRQRIGGGDCVEKVEGVKDCEANERSRVR